MILKTPVVGGGSKLLLQTYACSRLEKQLVKLADVRIEEMRIRQYRFWQNTKVDDVMA